MQGQVNRHLVTNGPIRLLHPELLRLIFLENTQFPPFHSPDQLLTARSSSQVCRRWREVILSSSSLWGRLIFVDQLHFTQVDDPWRNEVLKRSRSASLWIQGHVSVADHKNFLSFLGEHWRRVERVDITGDRELSFDTRPGTELWKGLESKAPNLKAFSLNYVGNTRRFSPLPVTHTTQFLFKDGAPNLREISVPNMKFDTHSPWLSNIRSIILSTIFSIQDMFTILNATPLLTNLDITMRPLDKYSLNVLPHERYQQCITLPLLDTFSLNTYFYLALPFLEFLDFPAACIPGIFLDSPSQRDSTVMQKERENIPIIRDLVIRRMEKHLSLRRMTSMTIKIANWGLQFFFSGHDGICKSTFLHLDGQIYGPPHIIEELSLYDYLPSVKEMTLNVDLIPSSSPYYLGLIPSCSLSLTTLVTDEGTLTSLLYLKSENCMPFPALKVLKLTHIGKSFFTNGYSAIWDFLHWQTTGPSPISVFDLSNIPFHDLHDMEYLDNMPGLEIVNFILPQIGPSQYECGSGDPEALRFNQIWRSHLWRMAESKLPLRIQSNGDYW